MDHAASALRMEKCSLACQLKLPGSHHQYKHGELALFLKPFYFRGFNDAPSWLFSAHGKNDQQVNIIAAPGSWTKENDFNIFEQKVHVSPLQGMWKFFSSCGGQMQEKRSNLRMTSFKCWNEKWTEKLKMADLIDTEACSICIDDNSTS